MRKHILSLLLVICGNIFAYNHMFLYTFKSNPFPETITNKWFNVWLHNIEFKTKTNYPSVLYPDTTIITSLSTEGITLKPSKSSTKLYIQFAGEHNYRNVSISVRLKASKNNSSELSITDTDDPSDNNLEAIPDSFSTILKHYTKDEPFRPRLLFIINDTTTITIKSITIHYTDNNQTPDRQFFDDSTLIASGDEIPLPVITNLNTDLQHIGWTSDTTTKQPITDFSQITTPLYALYSHPYSSAKPTNVTLSGFQSQNNKINYQHTFDEPTYISYAHFYVKNPSPGIYTTYSLQSDNSLVTLKDKDISTTPHFLTLDFDGLIYSSSTITISASISSLTKQTLRIDSVILGTIPATAVTSGLYTSTPATPFHIHINESNNTITEPKSAIDDISYSMTIDDSRYFFFSLPYDVPFSGISFTPVSGPFPYTYYSGYAGNEYIGDWVISEYKEEDNSWYDLTEYEVQTTGLLANHGYTIGLTKDSTKAVVNFTSAHSDTVITITPDQPNKTLETQYTNNNDHPEKHGWNLLGNPYYTPVSSSAIQAPYILLTNNTSSDIRNPYTLIYPYAEPDVSISYVTDTVIAPFTPFFIQTPNQSMPITPQPSSRVMATDDEQFYHFNIVCVTPENAKSVLTILSGTSLSDDYEMGYDLLSLTPDVSISHDGLAIYADNINAGDTIKLTLPTPDATLTVGQNIMIPESWTIKILPDIPAVTILDNTITDVEETEMTNEDFPIWVYTIDGRMIYTGETFPTSLNSGIYIIKTASGKTTKTAIK